MVASWACDVILHDPNPPNKETSAVFPCVRISMTSQSQLATITSSYFCCK